MPITSVPQSYPKVDDIRVTRDSTLEHPSLITWPDSVSGFIYDIAATHINFCHNYLFPSSRSPPNYHGQLTRTDMSYWF